MSEENNCKRVVVTDTDGMSIEAKYSDKAIQSLCHKTITHGQPCIAISGQQCSKCIMIGIAPCNCTTCKHNDWTGDRLWLFSEDHGMTYIDLSINLIITVEDAVSQGLISAEDAKNWDWAEETTNQMRYIG